MNEKITLLPDPLKLQVGITGSTGSEYHKNAIRAAMGGLARNGIEPWNLTAVPDRLKTLKECDEICALHGWMDDKMAVADVTLAQSWGKPVRQMAIVFENTGAGIQVKMTHGPEAPSIVQLVKLVANLNPNEEPTAETKG